MFLNDIAERASEKFHDAAHHPIDWNTVATWIAVIVLAFLVLRKIHVRNERKKKTEIPRTDLASPACPNCGTHMSLVRIFPDGPGRDQRAYGAASPRSLSSRKLLSQRSVTKPPKQPWVCGSTNCGKHR